MNRLLSALAAIAMTGAMLGACSYVPTGRDNTPSSVSPMDNSSTGNSEGGAATFGGCCAPR